MRCFDERIRRRLAEVVRVRDDLHSYQRDQAIPFLKANPFSALFIDMGLGKTISSLTVIVDLLNEFAYEKVLVIGPLRVATATWPNEIRTWEHTAPFNYSVIHAYDGDPRLAEARARARAFGAAEGMGRSDISKLVNRAETAERERIRRDAARSRAPIHIISRDWVEWLVNFYGKDWPYRMVVIDESSGFKDYRSNRFKALAKVRNTPGLIERLHLLTATPAAETYEHLFAQVYLMDRGERFGKHITKFRERYFTYNKWSMKWKLRPGCEEEILEKISDICLVMKAQDYLKDLKEPVIVQRKVTLDPEQMELYRRMEEDFVVTLPNGVEIEAETAATLSSKLLQMASGVLYETYLDQDLDTDDMRKVKRVHHLHDHKIEELKQIVEEVQGKPILVGYHFKSSLDRLRKAFPKAVLMDKEGKCLKQWNAGKIPMLLMHPQSGGHGLNMQAGGHNIAFFDIPWSLELFQQYVGRLARQGQKEVVVVQLLVAAGTLDEAVHQAISTKSDAQEQLFRILKRLIRRRRAGTLPAVAESERL